MMPTQSSTTTRALLGLTLAFFLSACGGGDDGPSIAKKAEEEIKPTVFVPKPTQFYEGTPYWEVQSRTWPQIMEWAMGPDGEYTFDSLTVRLSGTVIQSFVSGPKGKNHPLLCWFDLTVKPLPRRLIATSFNLDSVVFHDPLKKKNMPALPMLSIERYTDFATVRTKFSNNLSFVYTPDIVENQLLEPIVYLTGVDKKSIKIKMAPLTVTFLRELKQEAIPTDSLKWGPS